MSSFLPKTKVIGSKLTNLSHMWVFGYGSILWKTGFVYKNMRIGCVPGFKRRFWQGSTTHRGTTTTPGRVATLVEDSQSVVWGAAYELEGTKMVERALDHLGLRECLLGGYISEMLPFRSRFDTLGFTQNSAPNSRVLVFSATDTNNLYLGPASLEEIANQIVDCKGTCGYNVEYVTRLADYVRTYIPEDKDKHLFQLDCLVRDLLKKKNISLESRLSRLDCEPKIRREIPLLDRLSRKKTLELAPKTNVALPTPHLIPPTRLGSLGGRLGL